MVREQGMPAGLGRTQIGVTYNSSHGVAGVQTVGLRGFQYGGRDGCEGPGKGVREG